MAVDTSTARSRRALLAGGLAGVAAVVAQALERPIPTRAGEGTAMHVGGEYYNASSLTYINNPNNTATVFGIQSTAGGLALSGQSDSNIGVRGISASSDGVHGSGSIGVHGVSPGGGFGLKGESNNVGVFAEGLLNGTGLIGASATGVGVSAQSNGVALAVHGRAFFQRAGSATIGVGTRTKTVAPHGGLLAASRVHCTLDSDQAGLFLHHVTRDVPADTFRITLSANVASGKYAKVSWLVLDGPS